MWPSIKSMLEEIRAIKPCFVPTSDDAVILAWCILKHIEAPANVVARFNLR